MRFNRLLPGLLPGAMLALQLCAAPPVDFVREVRPILSDRCFSCHGPDEANRKAGLRLDIEDGVKKARASRPPVVVPGDVAASEILKRVAPEVPARRMPPPYSDRKAASGSARAARLAGKKLDIALTKSMIRQAGANSQPACGGEFMRLPRNFWKRRLNATPVATPRSTTFPPESRAMRRISLRCAPSATRTPNSLVRCATA